VPGISLLNRCFYFDVAPPLIGFRQSYINRLKAICLLRKAKPGGTDLALPSLVSETNRMMEQGMCINPRMLHEPVCPWAYAGDPVGTMHDNPWQTGPLAPVSEPSSSAFSTHVYQPP